MKKVLSPTTIRVVSFSIVNAVVPAIMREDFWTITGLLPPSGPHPPRYWMTFKLTTVRIGAF